MQLKLKTNLKNMNYVTLTATIKDFDEYNRIISFLENAKLEDLTMWFWRLMWDEWFKNVCKKQIKQLVDCLYEDDEDDEDED